MSIPIADRLLQRLTEEHATSPPGYHIIAQTVQDVQDIENAPAISMEAYLQKSGQIELMRIVSVYSLRGDSREQIRLLYMNAAAIRVWRQMGKAPTIIGSQNRPPQAALLALGVPFST